MTSEEVSRALHQGKCDLILTFRNSIWLCACPVARARARARNRNRFLELRFLVSFDYDYERRPRRTEDEHDSAGDRTKSEFPLKYPRFIADSTPEQIYRGP
jgi:hypothetical protein